MIRREEQQRACREAAQRIRKTGIPIFNSEAERIEVVDFGLGRLAQEGVQVLTLAQTGRISVKLLVLFPNQTEPEHWHPPVGDDPGKEETVRVIAGPVYFYIPGKDTFREGFLVHGKERYYTARHEVVMAAGDQITLPPGMKHWFQARDKGAVLFSFSTVARDALDCFSDPDTVRITQILE